MFEYVSYRNGDGTGGCFETPDLAYSTVHRNKGKVYYCHRLDTAKDYRDINNKQKNVPGYHTAH